MSKLCGILLFLALVGAVATVICQVLEFAH